VSAQVEPTRHLLGWRRLPWLPLLGVTILAAAAPLVFTDSYIINLLILTLIYSILNQSWNLTLGMVGAWNFGQLGLFAIGGYLAGFVCIRWGVSPWLGLPIGVIAAALANIGLAIPSMKLRGIYVALLTFSFAEVIRLAIIYDDSGLTGGVFGLTGIPGLFEGLSPQGSQRGTYWVTLAVCVGVAVLIHRLMSSPFGIAFQAMRDSTRYAVSLGISMRTYYVVATTLSAAIAGLAGALYAFHYTTISPSVMGLTPLSLLVLMILVGGMGTVTGPIVGTVFVMLLTEVLRGTGEWRMLLLGIVLLAILVLQPTGIVQLFARLSRSLGQWMNAGSADVPTEAPAAYETRAAAPAASGTDDGGTSTSRDVARAPGGEKDVG
jgi:branched-chain amino acid transport system permease protein